MQFSTTPTLEGQTIVEYCGVVTGEAILGANIFRDFFAGIRDIVGGRSGAYEKELRKAREIAFEELGSQARALGDVHALLLACMHRLAHAGTGQGNRLIWLYDIHLLAGRLTPSQWALCLDTAARRGLSSVCLDGLLAARRHLATEWPAAVDAALRPAAARDWLTPRLLAGNVGKLLAVYRSLPDGRSRLTWLREYLFPDADYMLAPRHPRHPWRLPLLYLKRIGAGARKLLR